MEIKIGKTSRVCHACERDFVHEEVLNSLVRVEDRQFVREDYCSDCWTPERARNCYSAWTPAFYDPRVAEQDPPEVFSPLRRIFYEAAEAGPEQRGQMALAYLAAQLLRRQKVFRYIKESEDPDTEERLTLFVDRIGNRLIEVRDPNITAQELEDARAVFVVKLAELEQPEAQPEAAEDAETNGKQETA